MRFRGASLCLWPLVCRSRAGPQTLSYQILQGQTQTPQPHSAARRVRFGPWTGHAPCIGASACVTRATIYPSTLYLSPFRPYPSHRKESLIPPRPSPSFSSGLLAPRCSASLARGGWEWGLGVGVVGAVAGSAVKHARACGSGSRARMSESGGRACVHAACRPCSLRCALRRAVPRR